MMPFVNGMLAGLFAVFAIIALVFPLPSTIWRKLLIGTALMNCFNLLSMASYGQTFNGQGAYGVSLFMLSLIFSTVKMQSSPVVKDYEDNSGCT